MGQLFISLATSAGYGVPGDLPWLCWGVRGMLEVGGVPETTSGGLPSPLAATWHATSHSRPATVHPCSHDPGTSWNSAPSAEALRLSRGPELRGSRVQTCLLLGQPGPLCGGPGAQSAVTLETRGLAGAQASRPASGREEACVPKTSGPAPVPRPGSTLVAPGAALPAARHVLSPLERRPLGVTSLGLGDSSENRFLLPQRWSPGASLMLTAVPVR